MVEKKGSPGMLGKWWTTNSIFLNPIDNLCKRVLWCFTEEKLKRLDRHALTKIDLGFLITKNHIEGWLDPFLRFSSIVVSWTRQVLWFFLESRCLLKSRVFWVKACCVCWWFQFEVLNESFILIITRTYKSQVLV